MATDSSAPKLQHFDPAAGTSGAALDANLVVTFSEPITAAQGTIRLRQADGTTIEIFTPGSASAVISGSALTLDPTSALATSTRYLLEFSDGVIRDLEGNAYPASASLQFNTRPATFDLNGTQSGEALRRSISPDEYWPTFAVMPGFSRVQTTPFDRTTVSPDLPVKAILLSADHAASDLGNIQLDWRIGKHGIDPVSGELIKTALCIPFGETSNPLSYDLAWQGTSIPVTITQIARALNGKTYHDLRLEAPTALTPGAAESLFDQIGLEYRDTKNLPVHRIEMSITAQLSSNGTTFAPPSAGEAGRVVLSIGNEPPVPHDAFHSGSLIALSFSRGTWASAETLKTQQEQAEAAFGQPDTALFQVEVKRNGVVDPDYRVVNVMLQGLAYLELNRPLGDADTVSVRYLDPIGNQMTGVIQDRRGTDATSSGFIPSTRFDGWTITTLSGAELGVDFDRNFPAGVYFGDYDGAGLTGEADKIRLTVLSVNSTMRSYVAEFRPASLVESPAFDTSAAAESFKSFQYANEQVRIELHARGGKSLPSVGDTITIADLLNIDNDPYILGLTQSVLAGHTAMPSSGTTRSFDLFEMRVRGEASIPFSYALESTAMNFTFLAASEMQGGPGDDRLRTWVGSDTLSGAAGRDTLIGDDGDDVLSGGPGSDLLIGGPGLDIAVFSGADTDYQIRKLTPSEVAGYPGTSFGYRVEQNSNGDVDVLLDVEGLQFDQTFRLDDRLTFVGGNLSAYGATSGINWQIDPDSRLTAAAFFFEDTGGWDDRYTHHPGDSQMVSAGDNMVRGIGNWYAYASPPIDTRYYGVFPTTSTSGTPWMRNIYELEGPGVGNLPLDDFGALLGKVTRLTQFAEWKASETASEVVRYRIYSIENRSAPGESVFNLGFDQHPLLAGRGNDQLSGSLNGDSMMGYGGSDTIVGRSGDDVLFGDGSQAFRSLPSGWLGFEDAFDFPDGDDLLDGGAGDDQLFGGDGNDLLTGGAGNDRLDGGRGSDLAGYSFFRNQSGVTFTITASRDTTNTAYSGTQPDGQGGQDTLEGVEGITVMGSPHNDSLTGGLGSDVIDGRGGDDTIDGGTTAGDIVSYTYAAGPVNVDLQAGVSSGADGNDVLRNIRSVLGSSYGDTLAGDAANNYFRPGPGNDTVDGRGGADITRLVSRPYDLMRDLTRGINPIDRDAPHLLNIDLAAPETDTVIGFTSGDLIEFSAAVTLSATPSTDLSAGELRIDHVAGGAALRVGRDDSPGADLTILLPGVDATRLALSGDGLRVSLAASDSTAPQVAISTSQATLSAGQTAAITFSLSEPSIDFNADDIEVSGGTLSAFTGSGAFYTALFTPAAQTTAAAIINVPPNRFSDSAGNLNANGADTDSRLTLLLDTTAPAQPALHGIAYHWKSHALLDKVQVKATPETAIAATPTAWLDLRAASFDHLTHTARIEVWINPVSPVESLGFTVNGPTASSLSFTPTLDSSWLLLTNGGTPGKLYLSATLANLNAAPLSSPTRLGELFIQVTDASRDVVLNITEIQNSEIAQPDQTLSMKASMPSGADGRYEFASLAAGQHGLSVGRPYGDGSNGVTAADALAALRIGLGINPNADPDGTGPRVAPRVSPYQLMAADANQDGKVSATDVLAILRMAVRLPSAPVAEWMFVEERRDFWDETSGQFSLTRSNVEWNRIIDAPSPGEVNLVGILRGDVTGSWQAPTGSQNLETLAPGYFQSLTQQLGVPLEQFGVYDA